MKQVIVPRPVSYAALALGVLIALALCFKAYEVATYLRESAAAEAAYYELTY